MVNMGSLLRPLPRVFNCAFITYYFTCQLEVKIYVRHVQFTSLKMVFSLFYSFTLHFFCVK